jgi:hypothetical protein
MGQFDVDWSVLKKALIVMGITLAISAGMTFASMRYLEQMRSFSDAKQTELLQVRGKYYAAKEERHTVEQYFPQYVRLQKQNFIGPENRLDWIEALRKTTERKKITTLRYEIRPQRRYVPNFYVETNLFRLNASEMVVELELLHEQDLLDVLTRLGQENAGLFNIKQCNLERIHDDIRFDASQANVSASCVLDWFTLQLVNENQNDDAS